MNNISVAADTAVEPPEGLRASPWKGGTTASFSKVNKDGFLGFLLCSCLPIPGALTELVPGWGTFSPELAHMIMLWNRPLPIRLLEPALSSLVADHHRLPCPANENESLPGVPASFSQKGRTAAGLGQRDPRYSE